MAHTEQANDPTGSPSVPGFGPHNDEPATQTPPKSAAGEPAGEPPVMWPPEVD